MLHDAILPARDAPSYKEGIRRTAHDAALSPQNAVPAGPRGQAAPRVAQRPGPLHLGTQTNPHSRRKNISRRRPLLGYSASLRPARWLLGRHQRHHRPPVQLRRHHHRLARSHPWNSHRCSFRLRLFPLRHAAMELHPRCPSRRHPLRTSRPSQQLPSRRRHHHHHHARPDTRALTGSSRSIALEKSYSESS